MKSLKEILEARGVQGSRSTRGIAGASDPKKAIKTWLREHKVRKCTINDDLTIDVNGDVDLTQFNFENFPDYIQFGVVKGFFWTPHEDLMSLRGCPREVEGNFSCGGYKNKFTTLEGAPRIVGGTFDCSHNENLVSLEGGPEEVGFGFLCHDCGLTSLKGAPKKVGHSFSCSQNKLTSLVGAPKVLEGDFNCEYNNLTSLKGAPVEVGMEFDCSHNKLTSLEGAPKKINRSFICSSNNLKDLKGAPETVENSFNCDNNSVLFTVEDVLAACKVEQWIVVNRIWEEARKFKKK